MEVEERPPKCGLSKHQEVLFIQQMECERKNDLRNVASANTEQMEWERKKTTEMWPQQTPRTYMDSRRCSLFCRWNGRGRTTTEMWPQQAPSADGMGEEEDHRNVASANTKNIHGQQKVLFILQMEWKRKNDHRNVASASTKSWNGRGRTTTEMWPQQTPGDGMEEEERPPKCGLSKHQEQMECERKNDLRNVASANTEQMEWERKKTTEMWPQQTPRTYMDSRRCSLFCRWNGRGRTTTEMWPQQAPRGALYSAVGMEVEEQPPKCGLSKHQEQMKWERKKTTEMWPQQTPRIKGAPYSADGM
ncbi:uncharacterized protein LOC135371268 isoform X2 [Ornithodoros turicata]|uniref:uncharacterized protein LOC135371268 isoform X2 n=1 Tax=Ornithodoros turicata TaxID=34597 RepID=UPI00313A4B4C